MSIVARQIFRSSPPWNRILRHSFKLDVSPPKTPTLLHTSLVQPTAEIFTLANVEFFQIMTSFDDRFDPDTGDTYATSY
jgi:hypothetical protein